MIPLNKPYIRRKEMDSVLTSMVEDCLSPGADLIKSLKKLSNFSYVEVVRTTSLALDLLLSELGGSGKEIILSALAPLWVLDSVKKYNFIPVIVDVDINSGLIDGNLVNSRINENTLIIINSCHYLQGNDKGIYDLGIPVVDILFNGLSDEILGDYGIISLEEDAIVSAKGGGVLLYNNSELNERVKLRLNLDRDILLSDINTAFALPQIEDLESLINKKINLVSLYKDSLLKSGYSTLDKDDYKRYRSMPIVVKRGINDILKIFKDSKVESDKAFSNSIVKHVSGLKCKNARSLANRTLIIPTYLGLTKDSVELILKLLSTLP